MKEKDPEKKLKKTLAKETKRQRRKEFIEEKRAVIKTKGIYVLPSLFTVGNIFCGFFAVITLFNHMKDPDIERFLVRAALLIMLSAFLDGIDGKVAKLTNTTSDFGIQLDSLADVISFGIAPGLLVYAWALYPYQRFGWMPAFLLLVCGALRLARFNVDANNEVDNKYFKGLPIPFAALMIASFVLIKPVIAPKSFFSIIIMIMVYGLAYLMVSTIPYRSFKEIDLREKKSAKVIFFIALFFVIVFIEPTLMIFLMVLTYISSGILRNVFPFKLWNFDKTLQEDILSPPEEFDDNQVEPPSVEQH